VRLITESNENIGIVSFEEALQKAQAAGLDLVEVAGRSKPVVCRIMDYGKFMYEESKKQRESRKKHAHDKLKEIQFHPNIDEHDYLTKLNRGIAFLQKGFKVKATMFFRGREMAHRDRGRDLLERVVKDVTEHGHAEGPIKSVGRNMTVYLAPGQRK
jgi:translation initiation factor IF-3